MESMRTVAFIGLGIMGRPMAANLVKGGFPVLGYSRRRESADGLVAAGGRWAGSVAEAVRDADVVDHHAAGLPRRRGGRARPGRDGGQRAGPARCTST